VLVKTKPLADYEGGKVMRRTFALLLAVTLSCLLIGCNEDTGSSPAPGTGNTPAGPGPGGPAPGSGDSPGGAAGSPAPVDKEEFAKMMAEDKPAYRAKLDELKAKADGLTGEEQKKLKDTIASMEERFVDITKRYDEMDKNSGYWASVSGSMKKLWEELKAEIDAALGVSPATPEPEAADSGTATEGTGTDATESDSTSDGESTTSESTQGSTEDAPPANNP
jgi:hypothetical protein